MLHESSRIDAALEQVIQAGKTPKAIHVGSGTYLDELAFSQGAMAGLVDDAHPAPIHQSQGVTHYKGIPVVRDDEDPRKAMVPLDHLVIETE